MTTLPTDYTDATTPTGATTEYPATTSRGINATHTQINTNTSDIATKASLTGSETLTNKTLTSPKVNNIKDTNGNTAVDFPATASAVNYVQLNNAVSGSAPTISVGGADATDLGIFLNSGRLWIWSNNDTPRLHGFGPGGNDNLNLTTDGTGKVQANGNTVFDAGSAIPAANLPNGITNGNTSAQSQAVTSGTSYYITGSNLNLPATLKGGMVVGTRFRWTVAMAKTAAGTGAFAIEIRRGTNGTTSDTADVSQTIGTQTAAVDSMTVDVEMVVTTTGASGAYYWTIIPMQRAATATGFGVATGATGQFSGTVSSVALNTASLKFGLSFKATTGTPTITVPLVRASAYNIS